jgi:hypothetical protein
MRGYSRPVRALRPGDRGARISSSDNGAPSAWSEVEVRNWHTSAALAASELVRLLGQCGLLRHKPQPREPPSTAKGLHRDCSGWRRCSPQSTGSLVAAIQSEVNGVTLDFDTREEFRPGHYAFLHDGEGLQIGFVKGPSLERAATARLRRFQTLPRKGEVRAKAVIWRRESR